MHSPFKPSVPSTLVEMHHSESVDPTLAEWINDLLHDLLGWGPWTFVVVLGVAIVAVPLWLIYTSLKNQRMLEDQDPDEV